MSENTAMTDVPVAVPASKGNAKDSANPKNRVAKETQTPAQAKEARKENLQAQQKEKRAEKIEEARLSKVNWNALRTDLTNLITEKGCHPIMVRLSWHDSGTWCAATKTGGAHACMRFREAGEAKHGANAGLGIAVDLLKPIAEKYPQVAQSDLWALAAVTAIKAAGGPDVEFRYGRKDAAAAGDSAPEGRLPDGDKGADHIRKIFYRMGFNDEEIVALNGAHTLGRCHADRSGFDGDWTAEPLKFDNAYFKDLFEREWNACVVEKTGCKQYRDSKEPNRMMLITDMALKTDDKFKPIAEKYARDQDAFFADFAKAFQKLQEFGYDNLNKA